VVIVVVKCVLKERESKRGKFSAAIFKEQKTLVLHFKVVVSLFEIFIAQS
jgi:hypothetical protein